MIREPRTPSARLIGTGTYPPDQRLLDVPRVAHLTHERPELGPDPQPAFAPAVGDAVARELVDGQLQVLAALRANARSARRADDELAQLVQAPAREPQLPGRARRLGQDTVERPRHAMVDVSMVERGHRAIANERVRGANGLDHLVRHRPRVVDTQQAPRLPFAKGDLEQRLV